MTVTACTPIASSSSAAEGQLDYPRKDPEEPCVTEHTSAQCRLDSPEHGPQQVEHEHAQLNDREAVDASSSSALPAEAARTMTGSAGREQPVHLLASICTTARFLVVLCMVTAMFMLLVLQLVFKVLLMPHQQDAPIVVCPDNEPEERTAAQCAAEQPEASDAREHPEPASAVHEAAQQKRHKAANVSSASALPSLAAIAIPNGTTSDEQEVSEAHRTADWPATPDANQHAESTVAAREGSQLTGGVEEHVKADLAEHKGPQQDGSDNKEHSLAAGPQLTASADTEHAEPDLAKHEGEQQNGADDKELIQPDIIEQEDPQQGDSEPAFALPAGAAGDENSSADHEQDTAGHCAAIQPDTSCNEEHVEPHLAQHEGQGQETYDNKQRAEAHPAGLEGPLQNGRAGASVGSGSALPAEDIVTTTDGSGYEQELPPMPALVSSDSEPEDSLDDPRNSLENLPANFRVKGAIREPAASSQRGTAGPGHISMLESLLLKTKEQEAKTKARSKFRKAVPTDDDWLHKAQQAEADADKPTKAEAMEESERVLAEQRRNMELIAQERQRLRAAQGLDKGDMSSEVLARCALRAGVAADLLCDKAGDGFAIRGSDDKYLKIMCTEGCVIFYHYACWRAFERFFKTSHPDFSWKNKGVPCFTDGCSGEVKLALELQSEDTGLTVHRRELLRLPDEPKPKPPAQHQAEQQPKERRQKGRAHAPAAPDPAVAAGAQPRKLARPTRLEVTNAEKAAQRATAPEVNDRPAHQQEEAAAGTALDPAVDLDAMSYVQQRKQASDSDLDRLAEGLKGKKEKRKRDRKRDAGNGPQLFALQELDDEEAAAQLAAMPWSTPSQAVPPAPSFNSEEFPVMHAAPAHATMPPVEPAPALMQRPVPKSKEPNSNAASSISASRQKQDGARGTQAQQTDGTATLANLNAAALKLGKAGVPPVGKAAAAAAAKAQLVAVPEEVPETRVNMRSVMRGAKLLGMTPSKATSMRVEAPEFVPPPSMPMSQASSGDLSRKSSGVFPKPDGSPEGSSTPSSGLQEASQKQLSSAARPYQPSAAPALPPPTSPRAGDDGALEVWTDLGNLTSLQVLGCDEDTLLAYYGVERFGIQLDDLANMGDTSSLQGMGLALLDVNTHQLHGLWSCEGLTSTGGSTQTTMAFSLLHKCPPLPTRGLPLEVEPDGAIKHPQHIRSPSDLAHILRQFRPGRPASAGTLAGPLQAFGSPMLPLPGPDPEMSVTPQPITPAPKAAARLPASAEAPAAANDSTASVAALSALLPGRVGGPALDAAAGQLPPLGLSTRRGLPAGPPDQAPPPVLDTAAGQMSLVGPSTQRGLSAAPHDQAPLPALPASPVKQSPAPAAESPGAAKPLPAQAANPLAMLMPHLFPSVARPSTPAAPSAPDSAVPAKSLPVAAAKEEPTQVAAPMPPKPKPALAPQAAYKPALRPYCPPSIASPSRRAQPQQHPQQQPPEQAISSLAPALQQSSFTDALLSRFAAPVAVPATRASPAPGPSAHATPAAPAASTATRAVPTQARQQLPPVLSYATAPGSPPRAMPSHALAPPAPSQASLSRTSSSASGQSTAAAHGTVAAVYLGGQQQQQQSPGLAQRHSQGDGSGAEDSAAPKMKACRICGQQGADYLVFPCRHWGPCAECVPTKDNIDLYPKCTKCGAGTKSLFRVYSS